ncbi:schwannomin-interacting protein 1 isoform X1 [Conger conger]|uniref:schwannomin-interacting protein 1 isoform X1 n=1 Tax=Conger conger TaxID=82655 RepID=UPI002A5A9B4D|nr:schwannomin-interacting protein 1 isoform X1 [Conger conger]XP_061105858.1 schwannomin-interacting protein 1 isoform X1 [Conger conger]XP_061105859.1 schwannomin-interacting protein 1 isoform X1 [Conger conger]
MEEEKEREREREEKERESEREEEKECDETEDSARAAEGAVLSSKDDSDLPIMHWEALSMRIAELEKQEEERKERLKSTAEVERGNVSVGWMEERDGGSWWEDVEADRSRRITALTSRFHNQKNLQLCFINDSGSEDEEGERAGGESSREAAARGRGPADQAPPPAAGQAPPPAAAERATQTRGLKLEVRAALSALRDKLWSEQKQKERLACAATQVERRPLALSDLQALSLKELSSHRASLTQAIHDLSSELVNRLLTRDQLRTEQDAMLLDVEDMTSV